MQSEVRKVLRNCVMNCDLYDRLDAAERADAAKLAFFRSVIQPAIDGPVQELRNAVADFAGRWMNWKMPVPTARTVRELLDELNAIIATKPDPVENRQATASGPVMHESVWRGPYNVPPNGEIQLDEHIRAIAADVVRDAMPDVLDGLAETWVRYAVGAEAFRKHAEKLRKERGS